MKNDFGHLYNQFEKQSGKKEIAFGKAIVPDGEVDLFCYPVRQSTVWHGNSLSIIYYNIDKGTNLMCVTSADNSRVINLDDSLDQVEKTELMPQVNSDHVLVYRRSMFHASWVEFFGEELNNYSFSVKVESNHGGECYIQNTGLTNSIQNYLIQIRSNKADHAATFLQSDGEKFTLKSVKRMYNYLKEVNRTNEIDHLIPDGTFNDVYKAALESFEGIVPNEVLVSHAFPAILSSKLSFKQGITNLEIAEGVYDMVEHTHSDEKSLYKASAFFHNKSIPQIDSLIIEPHKKEKSWLKVFSGK